MTDEHGAVSGPPLRWVSRRDGRLVPFEADRISRDLFAAGERLGLGDAFLARELTDSILHFLDAETASSIPTTEQIAELVVKVVRELGYPALAHAFAQRPPAVPISTAPAPAEVLPGPALADIDRLLTAQAPPAQLARALSRPALQQYSLRAVFSRDLAAAHASGLLVLGNLDSPAELAGLVLGTGDLGEQLPACRALAGEVVVLDSPEYALLEGELEPHGLAHFVRTLQLGLRATDLRAVVNLNCTVPPPELAQRSAGPLFGRARVAIDDAARAAAADALLDRLAGLARLRVDWHLGEHDFQPAQAARLLRLARRAADGAALAFVFDRPRRPVLLAEGVARGQPAVLMSIGLNLPRLAEQPGIQGQPERFLHKLGSLVRLALSAATQKRDFLRRFTPGRPQLAEGFLLERARLVLVPVGLEAIVRQLLHQGLGSAAGITFARQVLQRLREALQLEGRRRYLETGLDSADGFTLGMPPTPETAAGVTGWDEAAPPRQQLRAAGPLHAETRAGTAAIHLPAGPPTTAEEVADLLRHAWQQADLVRVRFHRPGLPAETPPGLWGE